jgi:hypothetical protein
MAIALRTISINAAFLQEIKEDHHELRQLMHHVAVMFDHAGPVEFEYARMVEMLGKLRDQLALHFSLEQAFGYFDDAISAAPHLSRRAEQLRAEHGTLFSELGCVVEAAEKLLYHETPSAALAHVATSYLVFDQHFHDHEARESELILAAFDDDLNGGD